MFCNIPGMSQPKEPAQTEMDKLAAKLTEMGIEFQDYPLHIMHGSTADGRQIDIIEKGRKVWDATCSPISYGGTRGLIEVMGVIVDGKRENGDVKGWLTADQVIEMAVAYQNKNVRKKHG